MIRVSAAVSGEVIAALQADDFEGTVKALKNILGPTVECSRFRQRLITEDGLELHDDVQLWAPMNLQVILLQLRADTKQQEQLLAACSGNDFNPNLGGQLCDWTALHCAAFNGSLESVCLLLDAHANINKAAKGSSGGGVAPLHLAAEKGHVEVVRLLLDAGANRDKTANDGSTPLTLAARYGHAEVVCLLLEAAANTDQATTDLGATPLHFAVQHRHVEVVRLLLAAGANRNIASRGRGLSPLHVAAACGHFEVAHLLES